MIQHIVLLKFKPGTTDEQIDAAFGQAHQLLDEIDGVERVTLGRNRGQDDHGYTHALIVKLSDDALAGYLSHPVRKRYIAEAHIIGIRSRTNLTEEIFDAAKKLIAVGCFSDRKSVV